ncbi:hypothetical protein CDD83_5558 [Cordyceps sp. RAO-2017]|nr:hypothetical protein CDD83_5558 [Cordyceps sp. RAO-2017]
MAWLAGATTRAIAVALLLTAGVRANVYEGNMSRIIARLSAPSTGNKIIDNCRSRGLGVYCGSANRISDAMDTTAAPYSDPSAHCSDVLKMIAIAIGAGTTLHEGPVIKLSMRPPMNGSCPQIQGVTATPDTGKGWPSCRYTLPEASALEPGMLHWWSRMVLDRPLAYGQIRKGGLDLEAFKGCADLREVFVSGEVTEVALGEDGKAALTITGRRRGADNPDLNWCRISRGQMPYQGPGGGWECILRDLADDLAFETRWLQKDARR